MIQAKDFVECARGFGYHWYTGVPCSFLTPFINYTIDDDQLNYVVSANEGDAIATASGLVLGGQRAVVMMQNSGLGNAVNPLTSLAHVFRIPLLVIITFRGDPDLKDEPQHKLMGSITTTMLDNMDIPWEFFPTETANIEAALMRAEDYMAREHRPYALVMRKGSVAPHQLQSTAGTNQTTKSEQVQKFVSDSDRSSRTDTLKKIIALAPEKKSVIIATTGFTGRELCVLKDRANQLYMVGSMGCASSIGLGLSLACPKLKVIVVDGDGAAIMRMGNFATIGYYGQDNLVHILLDNEVHDSTGGQATVSRDIHFATIAQACGYPVTIEGNDIRLLDALLTTESTKGPRFGHLKIKAGVPKDLPRPELSPEQVSARLIKHLGTEISFTSKQAPLTRSADQ